MYFHNLNNRFSIQGIFCFDKLVAHNSVDRTGNLMLVSSLLLGKPCMRQNNINKNWHRPDLGINLVINSNNF